MSENHVAKVLFSVTDLQVVRGSGSWVYTEDGQRYLDFSAGIAVTSTGHCHPQVVAAIQAQAERFIHAQVNVYRHQLLEPLAARLAEVTPPGIDTFFFANSGGEAVEAAVKLAKRVTGRPNLIVFSGAFHGRTHLTMAMSTSSAAARERYQPLPAGVYVAPFAGREDQVDDALAALRQVLATLTTPADTAAVVIEPVLGEGGSIAAHPRFFTGVAELCRDAGILLIVDEVQTGFGRTGTMFAVEQYGVRPDILVMAKGLGSGFPMSAIGASSALMEQWPVGAHGGTYGGNPLGCAAALATLEILTAPGFLDHVRARGEQLRDGLERRSSGDGRIVGMHGVGLMLGVKFADPQFVARVVEYCCAEEHLILLGHAGTDSLRWRPPLTVSEDEIGLALDSYEKALKATSG